MVECRFSWFMFTADMVVFVGSVVVDAFCCIAAGGVEGDFVFVLVYFAAASLLICTGAEDVED